MSVKWQKWKQLKHIINKFERPTYIPSFLRHTQPKERQLNHPITKDFEEFNNKLIADVRKKKRKGKEYNLSKNGMAALKDLK